ncbi:MAG: acetyl-CoA carboxylase, biotin carboxyl carrier protein [Bdellovibrionales bacterium RIFOXYD1_FULL_44_7]|nr:MAG: acetyl-CoA carboxylase, biotin carboxyl carrier protein [Bdellovibrionales bacterium RIFOXYD1_FULL_44_7]
MNRHNLSEVELSDGKNKVRLQIGSGLRTLSFPASIPHETVALPAVTAEKAAKIVEAAEEIQPEQPSRESNQIQIKSPFVGTFYRAPSPGAEPYIKEGQMVKKGDVLCIVEAMKLMNEIESDVDGVVTRVLIENASPVDYGARLFAIKSN